MEFSRHNFRLTIQNYLSLSSESSAHHYQSYGFHNCHFGGVCLLSVCIFRDLPPITAPFSAFSRTKVTLSSPFSHRQFTMRQSQSSLSLMDVTKPYSNILTLTTSQDSPKQPPTHQLTQIIARLSHQSLVPRPDNSF